MRSSKEFAFEAVADRMKVATGCANDAQLAKFLGISTGDLANRKSRNAIPWDRYLKVCVSLSVSVDWLLTGIGPMKRDVQTADSPGEYVVKKKLVDKELEGVRIWLTSWWETANADERIWMKVQMRRCFPEYGSWLDQQ